MLDFQVKSGFAHPHSPPVCLQPSLPIADSLAHNPDILRMVLGMLIEPSDHPMQRDPSFTGQDAGIYPGTWSSVCHLSA